MDQIFPDNGLVFLLKQMAGGGVNFNLYTNNYIPTLSDTLSNYTLAAWGGYTQQSVAGSAWVFQQVVGHVGSIQAPNVSFGNSSGSAQQAYGYIVTDPTNTYLLAAARFDGAPMTIPNGGNQVVTPLMGNFSGLTS